MTYRNRPIKQQPEPRLRKIIEQYIRITERIDTLMEALNNPGDYNIKEHEEIASEVRALEWQDQALGRIVVKEFQTVRRLNRFRKKFYPELDIKDLIPRFSGDFYIPEEEL